MTKISFVATIYNKAKFIPIVLEALRRQEGDFEREYIFVDDGSTDESLALLHQHAGALPAARIISQPNQGPSAAQNRGFEAATGDVIKPLDGDDVLAPWATQRLLAAMNDSGADWAAVDSPGYRLYDPDAPVQAVFELFEDRPSRPRRDPGHLKRVIARPRVNPSGWLARAKAVRAAGGCDERVFVQDYSIELRLACLGSPALVKEELVLAPAIAPGRITGSPVQILHDVCLIFAYHLLDGPPFAQPLRRFGLWRNALRAWNWAQRDGGAPALAKPFWRYVGALSHVSPANFKSAFAICEAFAGAPIRRAPADARRGIS